ncbi:MAG TPA: enoyl-CoA hydratase/isomerase family protein [Acidimicrobiia bacterium]|jgi:enoyl-CoA hydratase/carnithine racemase
MTTRAMQTLRLDVEGNVGRLTLNRPEKLNSFTIEMWEELGALGEELLGDPGDLRALIVTGEGRAFSSGIDTSVFSGPGISGAGGGSGDRAPLVDAVLRTQQSYSWLEQAPFGTIAAVRGYALGAGLQLALACDVRIFARGTSVGLLELKYGIIPDLGGTQRLPRLVGPGKAKELIFTSARMEAEEAHRIGLCEQLVSDEALEETADELATRIAAQPPLAIRAAKRAVNAAFDGPVSDGLRVEAEGQAECLPSDDMKEALAAFVEQRAPKYQNR